MAENISKQQLEIRVGTHGEDYGSWMSNPVFYVFGGLVLLAAVLAVLSFTTFHLTVLGVLLAVAYHADLDGVDPPPVRLRQRRHDGAGAPVYTQQS